VPTMTAEESRTVRRAAAGDAAAIAELVRRAFAAQSRPTNPPPSALRETAAAVAGHLSRAGGARGAKPGGVCGPAGGGGEGGGVSTGRPSVHPAPRRQAIARSLVEESEREARRLGLPRITLGVRLVLDDNRRLFRSCGFVDVSFHRHEGFTEPTWVMMERLL